MTIQVFLALFIFILMVLVSIEDAATGFFLLLMLIPLQHKELFSLVVWDVLPIRIAFFGILLTTFYRFYLWYRRYKKKDVVLNFIKDPILILLSLLFLFRLFSLTYAQDPEYGIKLSAFFATIIYLYSLVKYLYITKGLPFIEKSVYLYSILGFVTGVVAVIQFYSFKFYKIKFGALWDIPGHDPRVGSTFWDVNHYGAFVMSAIPFSIALAFTKTKVERVFWLFNTLFLLFVLFITQSRSAWMGMAAALIVYVVLLAFKTFKKYPKYFIYSGLSLLIILGTIYFLFGETLTAKYKQFMHTRLDSFDTHFILVRGAYEAYSRSPVFGFGYGNFNEAFRQTTYSDEYFFREKYIRDQRVPSHSIWGEVISETGIVGLTIYSLIFLVTLSLLFRGFLKKDRSDWVLSMSLIASIISLLLSGIFYTYNLEFFWLVTFIGAIFGFYLNKDLNFNKYFNYLFTLNKLPLYFLSVYTFFALFWDLAENKLIDWDEAIYAEISKNIVKTNDFLTLQWTLGTPWFEKPPLYMWLSSTFMRFLGFTELGARLPSAILGFLTVLLVYYAGLSFFKSRFVGFLGGIILVTTADFWYYSRLGMLDVSVGFFILATIVFGFKYLDTYKYKFAVISGLMCGLGVMTKSIVGLLPLPILGIYIMYLVFFKLNFSFGKYIKGILLFVLSFLLIVLPWHLLSYIKYGDTFIQSYINTHILGRGLSDAQGKTQPFNFYILRFRPSMRGWYLTLIPSLFIYFLFLFKNRKSNVLVFISALFIFLFFSISKSKLVWYIIPLYPFLSLICSYSIYKALVYARPIFSRFSKHFGNFSFLFEYANYIGITSILLMFSIFIYILNVQKLVFVPDFNSDRVKVIEQYNERYYDKPGSVKSLYYLRIQTPVVKFYTLGESIPSDVEPFTNSIKEAKFDEALAYISRKGEVSYFQNKFGNDKVVISYQAGAYYLMYVRSEEEVNIKQIAGFNADIVSAIARYNSTGVPSEKVTILNEINKYQTEVYNRYDILAANMPEKYLKPTRLYYQLNPVLIPGIY